MMRPKGATTVLLAGAMALAALVGRQGGELLSGVAPAGVLGEQAQGLTCTNRVPAVTRPAKARDTLGRLSPAPRGLDDVR
ncbi:hypothetical protein LY474_20110 [Myxococcus stipitatus]|uniref:hypothetical protein n=1 Tax=Myxococcus stipitatus TaxID=83455 RepID=UPI001F1635D2|nr:hypothetical protein [Myxococcus stipitatus]MCE9670106.1 hypothetical protein [Myxococcus stipitatus]